MASHADVAFGIAVVALNSCLLADDSLGEHDQCLGHLERRTRCMRTCYGLPDVVARGGVGGQTDDFTRGRSDGHDGTTLALEQSFAQLLQQWTDSEWTIGGQGLCQHE